MTMRIPSPMKSAALLAGILALFPLSELRAGDQAQAFTPSLIAPAGHEDVSTLSLRMQTAKKDLDVFYAFADHFSKTGETTTAAQLQTPLNDYLKKHVDSLLSLAQDTPTIETTRLSAEIMIVKTRLDMALNRSDTARATLAEMKKRFAPYQKIAVQTPGKMSTLDEVIRQLEAELSKSAASAQ